MLVLKPLLWKNQDQANDTLIEKDNQPFGKVQNG